MTEKPEPVVLDGLLAQILTANASHTMAVTDQVIDNLTERADTAEATVEAIRRGVSGLFSGRYAPSQDAILNALYPSDDTISRHRAGAPR